MSSPKPALKNEPIISIEAETPTTALNSSSDPTTSVSVQSQTSSPIYIYFHHTLAYLKSPRFYLIFLLGQLISLCLTGVNTFSTLLVQQSISIPAFQSLLVYASLNFFFTTFTIYHYGFKGFYTRVLRPKWWRYLINAFIDSQGNYFYAIAFRYTTVLSIQLINFWAIVVVVVVSFVVLKVRYQWGQVVGIAIACGGMGILLARDAKAGNKISGGLSTELKGDLFMLLAATFFGLTNVFTEFLVSKAPLYEVMGQVGFWGAIISGVQCVIFDRNRFGMVDWDGEEKGKIRGYLVGWTAVFTVFYSAIPVLLRLSSAAFFNISLLTQTFYGVAVGVRLFGYKLDRLYPVAFVMMVVGLLVYFLGIKHEDGGEAKKPWLGEGQEKGVVGVGTLKREMEKREGGEEMREVRGDVAV